MKSLRFSTPLLLLLPALIVLVATIAAPLVFSFYTSFTAFRLTRPETLWVIVGTRNYVNAFTDPVFWAAFGRTVLLLTIALNLEMLFGLGLALMVERATRGQRLLRTLMMFPMMFSPILVGFQFKFLFNDNIGLINNALQSLGV
ncbi:MAG TPA: sugar ABC transporter permease, partial [Roseiarcus sp.]